MSMKHDAETWTGEMESGWPDPEDKMAREGEVADLLARVKTLEQENAELYQKQVGYAKALETATGEPTVTILSAIDVLRERAEAAEAARDAALSERIWSDSGDRHSDIALARLLREQSIEAHGTLSEAGVDASNDERPLTLAERIGLLQQEQDAALQRVREYGQHKKDCEKVSRRNANWLGGNMYEVYEVEHVCGLTGFGALGDVCPGCEQKPVRRQLRCTCGFLPTAKERTDHEHG